MTKQPKKRAPKIRLPLPKKPGGPLGPPQGDKSYDRKRERADIEWEIQEAEGEGTPAEGEGDDST
jgi:hypothetical protein